MANTLCKLDKDSSLTSKNATQYVVYNELFMLRKGQPILKLNLISKIPADVLKVMKKYYKKDIDKCDRKLDFNSSKSSKSNPKKVVQKKTKNSKRRTQ